MSDIRMFVNKDDYQIIAAGKTLFKEGDSGDTMYFVEDGEVEISIHGKYIETVGSGGLLGELALISNRVRSATAVAKTTCKVVPINEKRFTHLVQQTPLFALQIMRVLADRLHRWDDYLAD